MELLFHAHSGLRYLVLLAGAVAVVWFAWGWLARRVFDGAASIVMRIFVGLVDLQVLLGAVLLLAGRRPPGIAGHTVLMVAAAVVAHAGSITNRRREEPRFVGPLLGVILAMTLIVGGILAIRDTVL